MVCSKVANRITEVSKNSQLYHSENDKEILKERYIFPGKRQEVIDDLRLK